MQQIIDHSIDITSEPDLLKAFDMFIMKWCGSHSAHLIDTDDNDGQEIRERIQELIK